MRKDVGVMCNLSQGVKIGLAEGEKAAEEKIIINMHQKGFTLEQIATATDKDIEEVKVIIETGEPAHL